MKRPTRASISLTPLVDIVFILMFFFMLASDLHRISARPLATPADASTASAGRDLFLRVHADGAFSLVGERLDRAAMLGQVRSRLEEDPNQAVIVHPEDEVTLQALIDVLDELAEQGVSRLTLG